MTPLRAVSLITCLLGFAVGLGGCKTVASSETFRYGFSEVRFTIPIAEERPDPTDFQLRAKSWKHEWRCNVFDTCDTDFLSTLYVFDKRTGKQVKWNRVEVFLKDGCNASRDDRERYKTVTDTEFVSFGWGDNRSGKYEHVSAFLTFYADWGSVNARVRAIGCP
jgi:hypothetical protein